MYTEFQYTVNGKENKTLFYTYSCTAYNNALKEVLKQADEGSVRITSTSYKQAKHYD